MVVKEIFSRTCGVVYLIPIRDNRFIFTQVGYGGDLGVFDAVVLESVSIETFNEPLLFRIQFGRVSPRKFHWLNKGMWPYKKSLAEPAAYIHSPVGEEIYTLVRYGSSDEKVGVDAISGYEPMQTWSHEHIVSRFRRQSTEMN